MFGRCVRAGNKNDATAELIILPLTLKLVMHVLRDSECARIL
jgi:hypothetical protein